MNELKKRSPVLLEPMFDIMISTP